MHADDVVRFPPQPTNRIGWADRNGQHDSARPSRFQGAYGRDRRRSGGDAVVDDDDRLPFDAADSQSIESLLTQTRFSSLMSALPFDIGLVRTGDLGDVRVQIERPVGRHRADGELGLKGRSQLSSDDDTERRIQDFRNLRRYGNASARNPQYDHRGLEVPTHELLGQLFACLPSITKHDHLAFMQPHRAREKPSGHAALLARVPFEAPSLQTHAA